jgi:NRAMP (natural resistance-associated macrophage protein)-like metal ion transporter
MSTEQQTLARPGELATGRTPATRWTQVRRLLGQLGPGLITGAADDDPSGIATYCQTGAQYGYGLLWTMPMMLPMMVAVQETCARIGMVTGRGLAGTIRAEYSRVVLNVAVGLLLVANVINLGADLGAMAAAARLLIPAPYLLLTVLFAVASIALEVLVPYQQYTRYLKWLAVSLFAYILTGLVVHQNWPLVLRDTLVPQVQLGFPFLMILVALLGTTISPYMFFWQASEEVEDEIARGAVPAIRERRAGRQSPAIGPSDVRRMRADTWGGMAFSQVTSWFIILTTAGSLHAAGLTNITSADQAASALEPLVHTFPHAGTIAKAIFAVGILALGLLAVPVFAASASYAMAETFGWREGLSLTFKQAPQFYGVIILATLAGLAFNLVGINPIQALVVAAVVNGVAAAPLILLILLIGNNRHIMGTYVNGRLTNVVCWGTFAAMVVAAIAMCASWWL